MSSTIHQEIDLDASPARIYAALTDASQFSAMSGGATATIDAAPGGAFSCFGGMISGRNIELVPDHRLVQAWRVGTWPEGTYSLARFELQPHGNGTRITFDHSGFPGDAREHLASGWHANYWEPLRRFLG